MGQKWWVRTSVMAPAALSVVALALPWRFSAGVAYVVTGPAVTSAGPTSLDGFTALEPYKVVLILITTGCAFLAALLSSDAGLWFGAVHGALACLVAIAALATDDAALGSVVLVLTGLFVLVRAGFGVDGRAFTVFMAFVIFVFSAVLVGGAAAGPSEEDIKRVAAGEFDATTRLLPVNGGVAVLDHGQLKRAEAGEWVTLVRVDDPDVTLLGIARDRLVYYRANTLEVRVVPVRGGPQAVLTGVVGVDSMTLDGKLLLRTPGVHIPTLRRLDITKASGRTPAESLDEARVPGVRPLLETDDPKEPMVFHENPRTGEVVALDNTELGRAVLLGARPNAARWEPLTGGGGHKDCMGSVGAPFLLDVDALAPDDRDGWWLHDDTEVPYSLLHVGWDGYLRDLVEIPKDVVPHALLTGADTALYLLAGDGLWRLPNATDLLAPPKKAPECVPHPFVANPVRLDPADPVAAPEPDDTCALPPPVNDLRKCWDALVTRADGHGYGIVDGVLYALGPAGAVQVNHPPVHPNPDDPIAIRLARGESPDTVPLHLPSLAFDPAGRLLILTDDVLLGLTDQGIVVLGQDDRLWSMTLVATADGPVVRASDGVMHRLGY
jgi:hypothetical protein